MKTIWHVARALFAAALFASAAAAEERAGVTIFYDFYYGDIKIAESVERLRFLPGGKYSIEREDKAQGLAKLLHGDSSAASRGRVDSARGLLMTLYTSQRGSRARQEARQTAAGAWRLRKGEAARDETTDAPVFDYLTAAYNSFVLGKPAGGTLWLTNGWRLREYVFEVAEGETAETAMGVMPAVALRRKTQRGTRTIWLAKNRALLPARLRVDDKGHVFTLVAKKIIADFLVAEES